MCVCAMNNPYPHNPLDIWFTEFDKMHMFNVHTDFSVTHKFNVYLNKRLIHSRDNL